MQLPLRHALPALFVFLVVSAVHTRRIAGQASFRRALDRVACLRSPGKEQANVQQSNTWTAIEASQNCAEQLSRFFPEVRVVRVPVQVTALRPGRTRLREATVLEFGGGEHAIFLSTLPLEFADRVKVEKGESAEATEGRVVAVQYHEGRKAVAIRFLHGPCHWVTQT